MCGSVRPRCPRLKPCMPGAFNERDTRQGAKSGTPQPIPPTRFSGAHAHSTASPASAAPTCNNLLAQLLSSNKSPNVAVRPASVQSRTARAHMQLGNKSLVQAHAAQTARAHAGCFRPVAPSGARLRDASGGWCSCMLSLTLLDPNIGIAPYHVNATRKTSVNSRRVRRSLLSRPGCAFKVVGLALTDGKFASNDLVMPGESR